jgi:hypothetical protein
MILPFRIIINTQRNLYRRPRRLRPLAIFFLNTLVCDLFQAFSAALNARWASLGRVVEDNFCVAQGEDYTTPLCSVSLKPACHIGAMIQLGDVGVAASTLALTVATLFKIVFEDEDFSAGKVVAAVSWGVVGFIWLFLGLLIGLPLHMYGRRYYGNVGCVRRLIYFVSSGLSHLQAVVLDFGRLSA